MFWKSKEGKMEIQVYVLQNGGQCRVIPAHVSMSKSRGDTITWHACASKITVLFPQEEMPFDWPIKRARKGGKLTGEDPKKTGIFEYAVFCETEGVGGFATGGSYPIVIVDP